MNKIKDERVLQEYTKIMAQSYRLIVVLILCSVLFQQFVLNRPPKEFMWEFVCVMISAVYLNVRLIVSGTNVWNGKLYGKNQRAKGAIFFLFYLISMVIIISVITGKTDIKDLMSFLLIFALIFSVNYKVIPLLAKKREKQLEDEMDK